MGCSVGRSDRARRIGFQDLGGQTNQFHRLTFARGEPAGQASDVAHRGFEFSEGPIGDARNTSIRTNACDGW